MSRRLVRGTWLLLSLGALACGSSDASDEADVDRITPISPGRIASYEGTYALSSFSVNLAACDGEGPDETAVHKPAFVMAGGPSPEPTALALVACAGDVECTNKVALVRAGGAISAEYAFFLDEQAGANELRGGSLSPGRYVDGTCVERAWHATILTRTGDTLRSETRTVSLADAPSATENCVNKSPAELRREAEGRPCSELRLIEGHKTGPLPG